MRLVSLVDGGFGRVEGDYVRLMGDDIADYLGGAPEVAGRELPLAECRLAAPVPRPGKIVCIGLNYRDHAAETRLAVPEQPVVFAKWANSVVGPGSVVEIPPATAQVDFEVELAAVIGRRGRHIPESRALDHVAGYTVANDLSARDLQFATGQWTYGKAIDGFLPLGPVLVTADEIPDPQTLTLGCVVNGEERQRSSTSQMIFDVATLVAYVSRVMTLDPGDVIATGTPPGVAMADSRPRWLKAGDEVTAWVDGVGELTTYLAEAGEDARSS